MSCLESQDTWKCQPQMLDFEMNSTDVEDKHDIIGFNQEEKHDISKVPIPIDVEDKHDIIGFNQEEKVLKRKVSEPKVDQEKQLKSSNTTVDFVSLIDFFTHDQITEHIHSLRKESLQIKTEDGTGIDANTCQLCERENLNFEPVPIFCICCGHLIGRRKTYFCRKDEEFDAELCFCSACYNTSKGGCSAFCNTILYPVHVI
ncbi:unnamed protein product [Lathyrus sativus]|nr:unnamed protein product [Lathyrus sativus]